MKVKIFCKKCGSNFYKKQSEIKRGRGIFCSKKCFLDYCSELKCKVEGCEKHFFAKRVCHYHYNHLPEVKKRVAESHRRRRPYNIEALKMLDKKRYENLKMEVFSHYSNGTIQCVKCGYDDVRALDLDHIEGNGNLHRKQLSRTNRGGGKTVYSDVKSKGFPSGYQVLCRNCNWIKHIENLNRCSISHTKEV